MAIGIGTVRSRIVSVIAVWVALGVIGTGLPRALAESSPPWAGVASAYHSAGLDEHQALAVLFERFAFGAQPYATAEAVGPVAGHGDGPGLWLATQLAESVTDPQLQSRLSRYEALGMTHQQLIARYPDSLQVEGHARRFYDLLPPRDEPMIDTVQVQAVLESFRLQHGFLRQDRELREQLIAQELIRAVHGEHQLREVLTDFWQNHFFTNATIFRARPWVLAFEEEAIRPHVLGRFRDLLGEVMKHPGMLGFHAASAAAPAVSPDQTLMALELEERSAANGEADAAKLRTAVRQELAALALEQDQLMAAEFWPRAGPNEELARALIDLYTLGPDGPQTAQDIAETARIFTGWTTMPIGPSAAWFDSVLDRAWEAGFIRDGTFLFRADWHDATEKVALGRRFGRGGIADGDRLLDLLASHPSTARHIAQKLAVRFVADDPPEALVQRIAQRYLATDGDLQELVIALVEAPEFWAAGAAKTKVKTPFEYAVSALRAVAAELDDAGALAEWLERMGQTLYVYHEPTGYPDRGGYWLDAGSMIARLAFVQTLVAGEIEGVVLDRDRLAAREVLSRVVGPDFQLR